MITVQHFEDGALAWDGGIDGYPTELLTFGNACYAKGYVKPRYPMPSTLGEVRLQAYPGIVCIDTPDTDNYVWAYDQWYHRQVFPLPPE